MHLKRKIALNNIMNSKSDHHLLTSTNPISAATKLVKDSQLESENVSSRDKPKKSGFSRCIKRMTRTFRTSKTKKSSDNLDEQSFQPSNSLEKQVPIETDNVEERKVSFEDTTHESIDGVKTVLDKSSEENQDEKQKANKIHKINSKESKKKVVSTEYQYSPKLSHTKSRFHIICSHNDLHTFDLMQNNSERPIRYTGSIKYEGSKSLGRILQEKRKADGIKSIIKNGSMKEITFAKDENEINLESSSFLGDSESQTR